MSPLTPPLPAGKPTKLPSPTMPTQPAPTRQAHREPMAVSRGLRNAAHKVVLYGPGGVGKSELASLLDTIGVSTVFVDIEDGTNFLDVARIDPTPRTFEELLEAIAVAAESDVQAIVIDSLTKAEELAVNYTLRTVQHEKGHFVKSIEAFGFGKGFTHVYESFLLLMQALDSAARTGKHIIGICHDCTANVPNPNGEDFIRFEPRLQSPPSGKGSIRHRIKEWADHLLYIGFDIAVDKEGKASGSGTRTIYPTELPTFWAKSRSLSESIPYRRGDATLWATLLNKGQ